MSNALSLSVKAISAGLMTLAALLAVPQSAFGQGISLTAPDSELKLAKNSPFRDPDIIYLEANELENDQINGVLTASGEVEGRYQDKTLRADKVIYSIESGRVIAQGNVVLVNANGSTQYADKLELSNELEAGNAANFIARFPEGGQLAAAFAARDTKDGVELYNAYYTACEACVEDGKVKKPTWRIKARKVTQDAASKSIRYRDAVFEFKGIPLFYTPYLAHPDPSVDRASGWMMPFAGLSGSKGLNFRAPYYFALSPSSELTLTPHVFQNVNPLMSAQYRKKFHSGLFSLEGSMTKASFFDNKGDVFSDNVVFTDPSESVQSDKLRSHFFTTGMFNINETWKWGFEAGYATDDNYLNRYDLEEIRPKFGMYQADSRRLMQQAFFVGQNDTFRFSTSAFGLVSLRTSIREMPLRDANNAIVRDPITDAIITDPNLIRVIRENDSTLPVILPKIELTKYFEDPLLGGRLKLFGDTTVLTRQSGNVPGGELATGYVRATGGLDWQKNWIAPAGIEVKPFANAKYDYFKLEAQDEPSFNFSRATGQVGLDVRWPFLSAGKNVNWIIEPRVQVTQSFGDGKRDRFSFTRSNGNVVNLAQDGLDVDLDQALLWNSNKSTGFDIWQEGFRADVGASVIADWGSNNRALLFLGQSYYNGSDNAFNIASGLLEDKSDLVGQFELNIGSRFSSKTRVRYDEDNSAFRRLDTSFTYSDSRFRTSLRYYKVDTATLITPLNVDDFTAPLEEISGYASVRLVDNWSAKYQMYHDIDQDVTRRQALSLIYDDDCTRIEFMYTKKNNGLGLIGNTDGFGIRISLLTLGDFAPE